MGLKPASEHAKWGQHCLFRSPRGEDGTVASGDTAGSLRALSNSKVAQQRRVLVAAEQQYAVRSCLQIWDAALAGECQGWLGFCHNDELLQHKWTAAWSLCDPFMSMTDKMPLRRPIHLPSSV